MPRPTNTFSDNASCASSTSHISFTDYTLRKSGGLPQRGAFPEPNPESCDSSRNSENGYIVTYGSPKAMQDSEIQKLQDILELFEQLKAANSNASGISTPEEPRQPEPYAVPRVVETRSERSRLARRLQGNQNQQQNSDTAAAAAASDTEQSDCSSLKTTNASTSSSGAGSCHELNTSAAPSRPTQRPSITVSPTNIIVIPGNQYGTATTNREKKLSSILAQALWGGDSSIATPYTPLRSISNGSPSPLVSLEPLLEGRESPIDQPPLPPTRVGTNRRQ